MEYYGINNKENSEHISDRTEEELIVEHKRLKNIKISGHKVEERIMKHNEHNKKNTEYTMGNLKEEFIVEHNESNNKKNSEYTSEHIKEEFIMEKIITGKNITKTFGRGEEKAGALNGVDIEINKGEFVAVMGPSGSGKSTLLFALSGTDDVTGGTVRLCDKELSGLEENELADIRRTKIGFVFQQPTMLKNLNLLDNIILPAVSGSRKDIKHIRRKAETLMERTGISGLENRDITEVSGGQLQRAGICRALINDPEIVFADEPTGALNSKAADEIMALLEDINKDGTAILLVTHDAKVAARADRVLFTKDGLVVSELSFPEADTETDERDREARTETIIRKMGTIGI